MGCNKEMINTVHALRTFIHGQTHDDATTRTSDGSDGLLGQIVEDDQSVLSVVPEVLSHGGTRERSEVLEWSGIGGGSSDNDRVLHGIVLLEGLNELSDGGSLLTDGNVDTVELLGLVGTVVEPLLVEDGVESDGWWGEREKSTRAHTSSVRSDHA